MKDAAIPLTRGHLYALGAMSMALAFLAFFVGLALGRRAPEVASEDPAVLPLVAEEVEGGSLEALLARLSEVQGASVRFPGELGSSAPSASVDGVPTGGWAVQVGEYADQDGADRLVAQLREAGLPAYRVRALIDGHRRERVRVAGYSTRESAAIALADVASRAGSASPAVVPAP